MDIMWMKYPNNLKKLRIAAGITQPELAQAMDKAGIVNATKQKIVKLEKGDQQITGEEAILFAKMLDCSPEDIFGNFAKKLHKNSTVKPLLRSVPIIAPVQAGIWRASFEYQGQMRTEINISAALPDLEYFAVEVVGDSMNLIYPEGTILVCASPYDITIRDGDAVIVQRVKDDEYESTVKILKIDDGRAYLVPRSSNTEYTPFVIPWPYVGGRDKKTGIERIEIIGVVMEHHIIGRRQP